MTDTTAEPAPETPIDRAALSAKLWQIAEHHIVAEWICCEPLEPRHDLCTQGYAALGMAKTLLVDSDPKEAWNPAAPLLDAIIGDLEQLRRERDLAIAHDRQPYPTAWAYEQACKAREVHRERADAAEARIGNLRADVLREVADICDEAAAVYAERGANNADDSANTAASALFALMERFQRKADEAEYVATPCSVGGCEPGGEPCSTHERLMAHTEGEHELCEPDCGVRPTAEEAPGAAR